VTCFIGPVKLRVVPVQVLRQDGGGAYDTRYQAAVDCGWTSRSIGTEEQAWAWGRRHALARHTAEPGDDPQYVPCPPGEHVPNRRTGYCMACNADTWPTERRADWTTRELVRGKLW